MRLSFWLSSPSISGEVWCDSDNGQITPSFRSSYGAELEVERPCDGRHRWWHEWCTVNVAILAIRRAIAVYSSDVLLTAVQLLRASLIMDTLKALALTTEQPTNDLLRKPPVNWTESLISDVIWSDPIAQTLALMNHNLRLQGMGL